MNSNASWPQRLQAILARENRSLLQFLEDAYPWTHQGGRPILERLQHMLADERQAAVQLAKFLQRKRIPLPPLGSYPNSFMSLPFVALDFLLPQLVVHQRAAIAQLEQDRQALEDAEARQQVELLLEVKQRHLKELEELATQATKAVKASA